MNNRQRNQNRRGLHHVRCGGRGGPVSGESPCQLTCCSTPKSGKKPNRAWTPTAMLAAASKITGRTYKRGQCELAAADLKRWADDMAAALPITRAAGVRVNTRARPVNAYVVEHEIATEHVRCSRHQRWPLAGDNAG